MRKWMLPLALFAAAFAAVLLLRAQAQPAATLDALRDTAWLQRTLALTEAQAGELARIQREYAGALEACCDSHCAARMALGQSLFSPAATPADLEAQVRRMSDARVRSELATIGHLRAVFAILDPAQQARFRALVETCVCSRCPNGFKHSCCEKPQGENR